MTRAGRRLVEDFLLPALDTCKYGELLKWIDREKRIFSIRWSHKNAAKWSYDDTRVFQDWDSLKGHFNPHLKGYYMQAKQRFRAALYKLNSVIKLPCEDKHVKKYQLVSGLDKKKEYIARTKVKIPKRENQTAIPTPVICKNTSYTGKQNNVYDPASFPSSPDSGSKSDGSEDKELQKCLLEYTLAQQKQMRTRQSRSSERSPIKRESSPVDSSDDAKSPISRRAPHIPVQPLPIYPSVIPFYENDEKMRYESPKILLVQTYHELREEPNDDLRIGCVSPTSVTSQESDALNLSMKSEDSLVR